ncbi:protein MCM10 homolog [Ceratina calcarata]|uniref:Protein MCM10 homolog n=1 Tax=Ceratina calcarata TaxID=156304 RepID=A0AAJ7S886_9HYME|nr:protein MCM10 homolog [Ceratina calcarata]
MDNDSDSDVGDILNDLLANEDTTDVPPPKETLKELDFNFLDSIPKKNELGGKKEKSEVHAETVDSSDDEDKRCFEVRKYSDYGRDIKFLLNKEIEKKNEEKAHREASSRTFDFSATKSVDTVGATTPVASKDVYSDPFFGLRIVSPVVSSAELKARMSDKTAVTISKVKYHLAMDKTDKDWVIAGVLISKSPPKTSQKGSLYSIWKISDLSENMSTVCLFMFSKAYKTLWKTTIGTVIGVLNPNVLESKDNTDLATLSIDNPQKMMILGKSKDMGKCRSKKKNGEACSNIVNINRCEFCLYHVKQEYKKCSARSELQSFSNSQKFSMDVLKKKSQQKKPLASSMNMPEFHAVLGVRSKKLEEKDAKLLALLSGSKESPKNITDMCDKSETPEQKMRKNLEQIYKSRGWKVAALSKESQDNLPPVSQRRQNLTLSSSSSSPRLGGGCFSGTIDLSEPITKKHINVAKHNAIKWVKENGKIKSKDPNQVRLSKEKLEKAKKRPREDDEEKNDQGAKKPNVLSDKFKALMQAKSAHTELIENRYEEEEEKYFNKLEMKERMEQKMLSTYKVPCKAVTCTICKYTSFSASDVCKEQRHQLRVIDAVKRFFKCADCGNRTVSLNRIPSHSCIKCSGSNWTRAAMMDERKTNIPVATLSIRGDEETFVGSVTKNANLNLLVPEKDNK